MKKTDFGVPEIDERKLAFRLIGLAISIVVLLVLFFGSWYTVPAGHRAVITTLGSVDQEARAEGLHFKLPLIQDVTKMSVRTEKYEADATAASNDLQNVHTKVAVNYRIEPSRVPEIYQKLGLGYEAVIIQPAVQESVKSVTAKFSAEQLITHRADVKTGISETLKARLDERGIIAEEISITDFQFSDEFSKAIEQKVTADQLKLKAINDLERIKIEAQQAEAQGTGERDRAIQRAQGEAESIRIINDQLSSSPQYVEWLKVQKWNGELPRVTGGVTPILDVGALATVNE